MYIDVISLSSDLCLFGLFSLCKEQNLVMMALLRFYNISTLRVGGNTEFEGETQKKT